MLNLLVSSTFLVEITLLFGGWIDCFKHDEKKSSAGKIKYGEFEMGSKNIHEKPKSSSRPGPVRSGIHKNG